MYTEWIVLKIVAEEMVWGSIHKTAGTGYQGNTGSTWYANVGNMTLTYHNVLCCRCGSFVHCYCCKAIVAKNPTMSENFPKGKEFVSPLSVYKETERNSYSIQNGYSVEKWKNEQGIGTISNEVTAIVMSAVIKVALAGRTAISLQQHNNFEEWTVNKHRTNPT